MPFIPHTEEEVASMLSTIGVPTIASLFDELPPGPDQPTWNPSGMREAEVDRLLRERAGSDRPLLCFAGAGAYDHYIPAAVRELAGRGEFATAYTPYQAEASQGTLQAIWEFQSMMTALTGLAVANASLYDGASSLAEAIAMAVRLHGSERRVLLPATVSPRYRHVVATLLARLDIELETVPCCLATGRLVPEAVAGRMARGFAALVIPQPNFFGQLEEVDALTSLAKQHGGMVVALVNPLSLGLLKPPGQWGDAGADLACGDGQPLGIPLAFGGPSLGFLCCRQEQVRQLPGRVVGRTLDREGNPGFVLTLQTREQHIRRSRANSNICTNQGLMALAATIHLSLLGPSGLRWVATTCHQHTRRLLERLTAVAGVTAWVTGAFFHEVVVVLPVPAAPVVARLADQGVLAGYPLGADYPGLENMLLTCATECRTAAEIETFAALLAAQCRS